MDAIQEFKVVTNSYSAEYGRSSSGVVSVSLKSGTNSLKGSLYEFFRDDSLNATNYFATTKPVDTRHQFGGAVGFPIIRNKTFFFGDAETGLIRRETTTLSTLPSAHGSSWSVLADDHRSADDVAVPGQCHSRRRASMRWRRASSATSRCRRRALPRTTSSTTARPIRTSRRGTSASTRCSARITTLYVRVSSQRLENKPNSPLPPDAQRQLRRVRRERHLRQQEHRLRPQRGLVAHRHRRRFAWDTTASTGTRSCRRRICGASASPASTPAIRASRRSRSPGTGHSASSNVPNADDSKNLQVSGDISLTKGSHTIKTGVQHYQLGIDFLSSQRSSGIFNFNGQYTGDPFADFLLGYASSSSLSKYAKLNFRTPYTHFFVQDDWRATRAADAQPWPALRAELIRRSISNDAIANFDLDTDPANPRIVLAGSEGNDRASRALRASTTGSSPRVPASPIACPATRRSCEAEPASSTAT